ncbi:MAG: class I SAM-dependent methyltransferase [Chloroflexi bacterium]|nr:MAG: class I SAM-dependent methyltransferase [Chloroflexota bacterium]
MDPGAARRPRPGAAGPSGHSPAGVFSAGLPLDRRQFCSGKPAASRAATAGCRLGLRGSGRPDRGLLRGLLADPLRPGLHPGHDVWPADPSAGAVHPAAAGDHARAARRCPIISLLPEPGRRVFPSPGAGGKGGGSYPVSVPDESPELDRLQRAWDVAGKDDPFWSVLSVPEKQKNRWDVQEFLQTGVDEINGVMSHLHLLGISASRQRALDFGCGPGRLTQALASHFEQVDGVDISPSMIALAERLNQRPDRCHYHLNDRDDLRHFEDQTFDLVYSSITLQHVGPANARSYLKEFIRVLVPGGVLVFQLPGADGPAPQAQGAGARAPARRLPPAALSRPPGGLHARHGARGRGGVLRYQRRGHHRRRGES